MMKGAVLEHLRSLPVEEAKAEAKAIIERTDMVAQMANSTAWEALKAELLSEAADISEMLCSVDPYEKNAPLYVLKQHFAWVGLQAPIMKVEAAVQEHQEALGFLSQT